VKYLLIWAWMPTVRQRKSSVSSSLDLIALITFSTAKIDLFFELPRKNGKPFLKLRTLRVCLTAFIIIP
jgi:hypothetical protein